MRAIVAQGAAARVDLEVTDAEWTRWASATFTGARHTLMLRGVASAAARAWIAGLPEAEFALRGHLVADLTVERWVSDGEWFSATLGVLTVEER